MTTPINRNYHGGEPPLKTTDLPKSFKILDRAADGCHRYGWLINIIVMFVMFAYFMGGINESIKAMDSRIGLLERAVFFQTRGLGPSGLGPVQ